MVLEEYVSKYIDEGYQLNDARSKVAQDIVLTKIYKRNFKRHITIKGGVVYESAKESKKTLTAEGALRDQSLVKIL